MNINAFVGGAWMFLALRWTLLSLQPQYAGTESLLFQFMAFIIGGLAAVLLLNKRREKS